MKLVTKKKVCGEAWRTCNPHNCPVREYTADGLNVGACWRYLVQGACEVHGQIYEFEAMRKAAK